MDSRALSRTHQICNLLCDKYAQNKIGSSSEIADKVKGKIDSFRARVNKAYTETAKDHVWLQLALDLGEAADEIQRAGYVTSRCCETLHAMRHCIIDFVLASSDLLEKMVATLEMDIPKSAAKRIADAKELLYLKQPAAFLSLDDSKRQEIYPGEGMAAKAANTVKMIWSGDKTSYGFEYPSSTVAYNQYVDIKLALVMQKTFLAMFISKYKLKDDYEKVMKYGNSASDNSHQGAEEKLDNSSDRKPLEKDKGEMLSESSSKTPQRRSSSGVMMERLELDLGAVDQDYFRTASASNMSSSSSGSSSSASSTRASTTQESGGNKEPLAGRVVSGTGTLNIPSDIRVDAQSNAHTPANTLTPTSPSR